MTGDFGLFPLDLKVMTLKLDFDFLDNKDK